VCETEFWKKLVPQLFRVQKVTEKGNRVLLATVQNYAVLEVRFVRRTVTIPCV